MKNNPLPSFREALLECREYRARQQMDLDVTLWYPDLSVIKDEVARRLTFELKAYVASDSKTVEIPVLASWWDAVKLRFVPAWLMEQCDWLRPDYTRISIRIERLWPDVKVDGHRTSVRVPLFNNQPFTFDPTYTP